MAKGAADVVDGPPVLPCHGAQRCEMCCGVPLAGCVRESFAYMTYAFSLCTAAGPAAVHRRRRWPMGFIGTFALHV